MSAASPSSTVDSHPASKLQLPSSCIPPSSENPPKQAVWLIFGATGHIGRSLVRSALAHGDKVTAVGRQYETTPKQMSNWHHRCQGLLCDVRVRETVEAVIQESIAHWSKIDIIVNCTGYGVVAAAEDQTAHDLHDQFNTNFMGTLHIIQISLPYFRTNKIPGRYLIFSSTAGALGVPGLAPYCATKYAVEGLIESMLYEVDCYGIKATLVEPGFVRLDDDDGDGEVEPAIDVGIPTLAPRAQIPLPSQAKLKVFSHFRIAQHASPAYASSSSPSAHAKRTFIWFDKRQPTSAVRSAELVWQLGHCRYPPLRLLLGKYAVESIRDRLRCIIEEIEDWKVLHFPAAEDEVGDERKASEAGTAGTGEDEGEAGADADADDDALGLGDGVDVEMGHDI